MRAPQVAHVEIFLRRRVWRLFEQALAHQIDQALKTVAAGGR